MMSQHGGNTPSEQVTDWRQIAPKDAIKITLPHDGIEGPMNEMGERCPWPWDPQQLVGAPLGQYHCPYCGGMQVAGQEHLDWSAEDIREMETAFYGESPTADHLGRVDS